MANALAPTNATSTPLALPQRRSAEYKGWIAIELGRLAAYLGQQGALDSEGYRQAEMANDLCDTRPSLLLQAISIGRRGWKFFPTSSEILDVYHSELKKITDRERDEARRRADREDERIKAEAEANPEEYTSVADILKGKAEQLSIDRPRHQPAQPSRRDPVIHECPHCGGRVPFGVADLVALTAEDLRGMADGKDRIQAAKMTRAQVDARLEAERIASVQKFHDDNAKAVKRNRRRKAANNATAA